MAEGAEETKLVLKPGGVKEYLSNFSQSADYENFFYQDLILNNRRVEALAKTMEEVKEVRKLDLGINNLQDVAALKDMQQLIYLNLSKNKIKSFAVFCTDDLFPNLKWLDISNNKITEFPALKLAKLEYLDIGYNKLEKVNEVWNGHPTLRILKTIDNKFKTFTAFKALPNLEELYMGNNMITALSGWETIPAVKKLHLRRNKIEKIDEELLPLEKLEYINLRGNKIASLDILERLFKNVKCLDINVLNNPIEQNASSFNMLVADVLVKNPRMQRFCKHKITETNQLEAVYLAKFKWNKSEEERKRKEAEEKAKDGKAED